ncbi:MAG: tRNA (N6-threonylcarbamoyladenosine(37)-N6)-methyltransferase TrmO, partial [Bdellovibrionaceae bacterium]|nr:tRNA (N6-threonylcarbamoyladenosine(37)-N6)-methyltransferase TrmO [Pseudobdellovibrionaceae bacterium]
PRQSLLVPELLSEIIIFPEFQPELSLQGLSEFSHLWILWFFHGNPKYQFHGKVRPPRLSGQSIGLFATRSPFRPNPIAMSVVKLLHCDLNRGLLLISGGDMMDGTPVLDVKPYLREVDAVADAVSGWCERASRPHITVEWSPQAAAQLYQWPGTPISQEEFKHLVTKLVALDPRPVAHRQRRVRRHVITIYDWNCIFCFKNPSLAQIVALCPPGNDMTKVVAYEHGEA